ncbi:MAG: site-specific integrase [Lentisphaerae bacterium]|nr:site-specific integrase [Lentisphaerota bacterium]
MRRSPFWYCAFTLPDGRRTLKSTGTTEKRKAVSMCLEFEHASRVGREGRLTEHRARETIAHIFSIANQDKLPCATVADFLKTWLQKKRLEVAESSHAEYSTVAAAVLEHLADKADKPLDAINRRDAARFRDALSARVSGSTVNKYLKICRIIWGDAVKDSICRENIFKRTDMVKAHKSRRRAFTLTELGQILDACDAEWRGMVIAGLYTGQRLGDVATLTWRQIDMVNGTIHFSTHKTDKAVNIPIAAPLMRYLMDRPSADTPDTPLFERLASLPSNTLARQFSEILMHANLIAARTHAGRGIGRDTKRAGGGLSYHCLRHTATSLLKNAGVSDVVAREIIGHDSEAISRAYTHIEQDTLRNAVNLLPDVTANN